MTEAPREPAVPEEGMSRNLQSLRVCLASPLFPPAVGGEERVADLLARGLSKAGHRVTVTTQRIAGAAAEVRDGVRIDRVIRPVSRGPLYGPTYVASLAGFLVRRRGAFDVIQTSYLYWDAVTAALLKSLLKVRLVVRIVVAGPGGDLDRFTGMRFWPLAAGLDRPTLESLVRLVLRRADAFIVLNETTAGELAARGVHRERCHIVPNGVDVAAFRRREAVRRPEGPWRVVCVGRLVSQKGQDLLLRALPRARAVAGPVSLTLVGGGPDRPDLERLTAELGLGHAVHFAGQVKDVRPALDEADLFVLPSRFEGHPLALLEAMAAGLPIVATAVAGNTDAIRPGEDGLLVRPEDPAALAEAIGALLVDRKRATRLGTAARARVAEQFSAETMVAQTLEVFRAVYAPPRAT